MSAKTVGFRDSVLPSDPDAVRAIVESSGFFSKEEIDIAVELVDERLKQGLASGYYFIFAEQNQRVVGYTCFGPVPATKFSYDLYWIAVHNDFRGAGIGKKLMLKSEEAISRLGGRRIYIETSSREQYQPTRAFYLASGYKQDALLEDFYAPGDSKVIFVKAI